MPSIDEIEKFIAPNRPVILVGGAKGGKTNVCNSLAQRANNAYYINAILPLNEWAPAGKGTAATRLAAIGQIDLLIIDNAEWLKGRKYHEATILMDKAKALVVTARSYHQLPPRIVARLENNTLIALSKDSVSIDISYIILAALILFLVVSGNTHSMISLAAIRYAFVGSRGFGR